MENLKTKLQIKREKYIIIKENEFESDFIREMRLYQVR